LALLFGKYIFSLPGPRQEFRVDVAKLKELEHRIVRLFLYANDARNQNKGPLRNSVIAKPGLEPTGQHQQSFNSEGPSGPFQERGNTGALDLAIVRKIATPIFTKVASPAAAEVGGVGPILPD